MKNLSIKIVNQKNVFVATQDFWDQSIFYSQLKSRKLNPDEFLFCWQDNKDIKEPDTFDSILKKYLTSKNTKVLKIHLKKKAFKISQSSKISQKSNVGSKVFQQTKSPDKAMNNEKKLKQQIAPIPDKKQQKQVKKQLKQAQSSMIQFSDEMQESKKKLYEKEHKVKQNVLKKTHMIRVSKHHYQPIYNKDITNQQIQKIINQPQSQDDSESDFQQSFEDEKSFINKKKESNNEEISWNPVAKQQKKSKSMLQELSEDDQNSDNFSSSNLNLKNGISEIKCYNCFEDIFKQNCAVCNQKGYLPRENSYFLYINQLLQKQRTQKAELCQLVKQYINNRTL